MTGTETGTYIAHHLNLAGRTDTLFSDDATSSSTKSREASHERWNNLAIQALISAAAEQKSIVDESSLPAAATEITSD